MQMTKSLIPKLYYQLFVIITIVIWIPQSLTFCSSHIKIMFPLPYRCSYTWLYLAMDVCNNALGDIWTNFSVTRFLLKSIWTKKQTIIQCFRFLVNFYLLLNSARKNLTKLIIQTLVLFFYSLKLSCFFNIVIKFDVLFIGFKIIYLISFWLRGQYFRFCVCWIIWSSPDWKVFWLMLYLQCGVIVCLCMCVCVCEGVRGLIHSWTLK